MRNQGEVLATGDPAIGWAFACSRTGSSHHRDGKPCQDAFALWAGSSAGISCLVAAVADGHGDDRHDLSHLGSALAVRTAVEELIGLHTHYAVEGKWAELKRSFKADFPRRLGRRWRDAVLTDGRDRLEQDFRSSEIGLDLLTRYGTTLIVTLVVGDVLLVGQLGDGGVLLLRNGVEVERPIAGETSDVGTVTDSLCSPDAHRRWQTATLERGCGGLLLMATDGLTNAFADESQWHAFARSLGERLRDYGLPRVTASLPDWLDRYSGVASGDDITLALVAIEPLLRLDADAGKDRSVSSAQKAGEGEDLADQGSEGRNQESPIPPESQDSVEGEKLRGSEQL